jgi:hypothetical protein
MERVSHTVLASSQKRCLHCDPEIVGPSCCDFSRLFIKLVCARKCTQVWRDPPVNPAVINQHCQCCGREQQTDKRMQKHVQDPVETSNDRESVGSSIQLSNTEIEGKQTNSRERPSKFTQACANSGAFFPSTFTLTSLHVLCVHVVELNDTCKCTPGYRYQSNADDA